MNYKHKNKLIGIIALMLLLSAAAGLILYALKQNINLFYTPTQLQQATTAERARQVRIGGYVEKDSLQFAASGNEVSFKVTDRVNDITVYYKGLLPNLFREGQGIVVTGKLNQQQQFIASEVLAKHDEKYMPPAVAKALKATQQQQESANAS